MDYELILNQVIDQFYPTEFSPDTKGLVQWDEPTEREKERAFKKTGKHIFKQRIKYKVISTFYEKEIQIKNDRSSSGVSIFQKIYISLLEDGHFCVIDDVAFGLAGGVSGSEYELKKNICSNCEHQNGNIIIRKGRWTILRR
jgi:hypothetical protein